jgi:hypothetical protein
LTTDVIVMGFAQLEAGAFPSPWIETTTATTRTADSTVLNGTSWRGVTASTAVRRWRNGSHTFTELAQYRDPTRWVPAHKNVHLMSERVYPRALTATEQAALAPDAPFASFVINQPALNNLRYFGNGNASDIIVTGSGGSTQTITLSANDMSNHTITVPLPARVAFPTNAAMTSLNCSINNATGSIPNLSANPALVNFQIYSNQLTGSIPDLSNNTALSIFQCYSNQLTGSIPDLSNNTALSIFQCNANQLTGSIPDLSANTALMDFRCNANQLTGSIPDLSNNTALTTFYCHTNQLTGYAGGTISATLGNFQAQSNLLTQSAVDAILAAFVAAGRTSASGTCILNLDGTGNSAPSATGLTDKATLQSRGWTVTTN